MTAILPLGSSTHSLQSSERWAQNPEHPVPAMVRAMPSQEQPLVYEIIESDPLPVINITQSLRSVWLDADIDRAYARSTRRWKVGILSSYVIGYACCWVVIVAPARIGRWIAPIACITTSFTTVTYCSLLRYEIVCLVARTYEFWFFSTVNLVSSVLFAIHLGDVRAVVTVPLWLGLQNNILTDANTVFHRSFLRAATVTLLFLLFLITTVSLGWIDDPYAFDVLRIDANRRLTVQDTIVQGCATQFVVLARSMYRRWISPTWRRVTLQSASTITCVTIRARVKLRRADEPSSSTMQQATSVVTESDGGILVPLKLVPVPTQFCADRIVVPTIRALLFSNSVATCKAVRTMLLVVAYVGLSLAVATSLFPTIAHSNELRVVSFVCSSLFIGCLSMTPQRQLLRRLVFTFDFAFLSIQLVVVHVCLCDMLGWGYAALPVATIWLWIQWVLTHDAVTPVVKAKWGIRRRLPAIIMLVFIVSQVLVFVAVLAEDTIVLRNRVIVCFTIGRHVLEIKVIPTLLSRMVILFGWSWKVLWRMWTIRDDELLMIQGAITYVNVRHERKRDSDTRATV